MAWQASEQRRINKGTHFDVLMKFIRDNTGEVSFHTFRFTSESEITNEGPARFANKSNRLELKWSDLNRFDIGEESTEILKALIVQIRNYPNATISQAVTWYDTNYPDALWKGTEFFKRAQNFIEKQLGMSPTWDQFKTYVINNVFQGVDG